MPLNKENKPNLIPSQYVLLYIILVLIKAFICIYISYSNNNILPDIFTDFCKSYEDH